MKVTARQLTSWEEVVNSARTTVRKGMLGKEPSRAFRMGILMSRHAPVRKLTFSVMMEDIPYFVSVHIVRHKVGVEHFVSTQRTDRTGEDRRAKRQDALVDHEMFLNAEALIAMSRKRLCAKADPSTVEVWRAVREAVRKVCPEMAAFMRPECWWCGNECTEMVPCGRCKMKKLPEVEEEEGDVAR